MELPHPVPTCKLATAIAASATIHAPPFETAVPEHANAPIRVSYSVGVHALMFKPATLIVALAIRLVFPIKAAKQELVNARRTNRFVQDSVSTQTRTPQIAVLAERPVLRVKLVRLDNARAPTANRCAMEHA